MYVLRILVWSRAKSSPFQQCIAQLDVKFPGSPRVDKLRGLRLEALGKYDDALTLYNALLEADLTNVVRAYIPSVFPRSPIFAPSQPIWKRKISLLRSLGRIHQATESLVKYLDTFYGDPEGWLELADIYTSNVQ